MFGGTREAVRVKVKKCEGKLQPELRKFSVDPQITSLEVLISILIKAFDIKSDFTLLYRTVDDYGQEVFLPLLSDWDLDAAFLKAHNNAVTNRCEPCVQLRVDMKPFSEASEDWEPPSISPAQVAYREQSPTVITQQQDKQEVTTGLQGIFMNHVEKTFNMVSRALNLNEDPNMPPRPPLNDHEFRTFLDAVGRIHNTVKLKEVIYLGGIEPSLRKVVWKHILNVYPDGMTGKERMDYIKRKANEYYSLKSTWKDCVQQGKVNGDLTFVTGMVRKDVLRTDRHHPFYAGSDDNQNIASLFNILTTYALNHPTVSYCQGMSDLASPLLVTMGDEAHAYICLCALMTRLRTNFLLDGEVMTLKFAHLTECLQVYDMEFYNYLKFQQADDLLFCYRWLLLEMKREFAFEDALRMLEVLWASLPLKSSNQELPLMEKEFDPAPSLPDDPPPISPLLKTPRENAYTKLCAIRRQSSSFSLTNVKTSNLISCKQMNLSLDENVARQSGSLRHAKEFQSFDDATVQSRKVNLDGSVFDDKRQAPSSTRLPRREIKSVPENELELEDADRSAMWSSTGNLHNGTKLDKETPLGNQIRLLRDKISMHNNKLFTSLDQSDDSSNSDLTERPKLVKNLNEFLNFASKTKTENKILQRTQSVKESSTSKNKHQSLNNHHNDSLLNSNNSQKSALKLNYKLNAEYNDGSSPDDSQEYCPMTTSVTRELRLELEHLDRQVFGPSYDKLCTATCDSPTDSVAIECKPLEELSTEIQSGEEATNPTELIEIPKILPLIDGSKLNVRSAEDIYVWENPLHSGVARVSSSCPHTPDEQCDLDYDGDTGEIIEEHSGKKSITPIRLLRKNQAQKSSSLPLERKHSSNYSSDTDSSEPSLSSKTSDAAPPENDTKSRSHKFFSNMSQELENARKNCETLLNAKQPNLQSVATTINNFQKKYEVLKTNQKLSSVPSSSVEVRHTVDSLPPPTVFGGGNPFLMFLCLTVLLQHRDFIMRNRMDYNELAMHFDKMVRKHNVTRVLNQARQMYAGYLKLHDTTA